MKFLVVILLLVLVLAVTNPGLENFVEWAANRSESAIGTAVARPVLRNTTERTNYVVASLFEVKTVGENRKYLGIAGQFLELSNGN